MASTHQAVMKGCVCMLLGRPEQSAVSSVKLTEQSAVSSVKFTWQSIASKSLALSLKAMISVGHTKVNACRQDKRTACQQATDKHGQVVQGKGGAGACGCWCCGGCQL
jgi:phosphoenolpyruvate carboxylase